MQINTKIKFATKKYEYENRKFLTSNKRKRVRTLSIFAYDKRKYKMDEN